MNNKTLIFFNKPYMVLCQFSGEGNTLANHVPIKDVYPAGRLDKDSEGLLLLTDDGRLQHEISNPRNKMKKYYWVQVEGIPDERSLDALRKGISVKDQTFLPASVQLINEPSVWTRTPPIRERKSIPTSWLEIIIQEGKNRQVRRMTAAIGYPTLRLIRHRIGDWHIDSLKPGEYRNIDIEPNGFEKR